MNCFPINDHRIFPIPFCNKIVSQIGFMLALFSFSIGTITIAQAQQCDLYPIALHQDSLNDISVSDTIPDIFNGAGFGNSGWLTWTGGNSNTNLANSLTPPGESQTYTNPDDPNDNVISVGDWVEGKTGNPNSKNIRDALDSLIGLEIKVPVWDQFRGQGSTLDYHIVDFAIVNIISYKLPGDERITATFLGFANCDGSNSRPTANAGPDQSALVGETVKLDGSGSSDIDGDALTFLWTFLSKPENSIAVLDDSSLIMPTFAVDLTGEYVIQLIVNDGTENSDPDTVIITTDNSSPVANAGLDQSVFVNETVTLDGSGSTDVDGDSLTYAWSLISIPVDSTAVLSNSTEVMPTFLVDKPGTYIAQLIVNDGQEDSLPATISITTLNSTPIANAGPDQTVFVGEAVQLDGSESTDVDGDSLTFQWAFISIPNDSTANLSDSTVVKPSFAVDLPGTYAVQLIVNDGNVNSPADSVVIITVNSPPVANAGEDQSALVGDIITLDGTASSDVDGDLLSFQWSFTTRPENSSALLSDPNSVIPSFTIDVPGIYVVQLIVNDGNVNSAPDTVMITTENSPPVADAGSDETAFVGDIINLDGSDSNDVDGDTLTYEWSILALPDESTTSLSDPMSATPTFEVDRFGTYIIQLIVNDGTIDSAPDTVTISTQNSKPVANAGTDQSVFVNETVQLDGSASKDVDGDPLTYQWSLLSLPPDSQASLSDPNIENPTFLADKRGMYVIQLIVNDGSENSDPDSVVVVTVNRPPVAHAGNDQTVFVTETVILDGSATSDIDGDPLSFNWSFTAKPVDSTAELSDPTVENPSFVADKPGIYTLQLVVNDGNVDSNPDTVTISTNNTPPTAGAGPDQNVIIGDTINLDGSGSTDADGDTISYQWTITSFPEDSTATLSNPNSVDPSFIADIQGTYNLQLIVNDGTRDSEPDTLVVIAERISPVLDDIGDQTVNLGQTLEINLTLTGASNG